ncbi:hypothetical protein [Pseudovibrio ascidiaceicola]|uniref:hypothetical protein n=1 Tax=Pseudovibrio ascidiaceicola TaxID=285279 RepID=UPI000D685488|nr:hypothetical protein [Pseudovibrio ascidiaceicola]
MLFTQLNDGDEKSLRKSIFVLAVISFLMVRYDMNFTLPSNFISESNNKKILFALRDSAVILLIIQIYFLYKLSGLKFLQTLERRYSKLKEEFEKNEKEKWIGYSTEETIDNLDDRASEAKYDHLIKIIKLNNIMSILRLTLDLSFDIFVPVLLGTLSIFNFLEFADMNILWVWM